MNIYPLLSSMGSCVLFFFIRAKIDFSFLNLDFRLESPPPLIETIPFDIFAKLIVLLLLFHLDEIKRKEIFCFNFFVV